MFRKSVRNFFLSFIALVAFINLTLFFVEIELSSGFFLSNIEIIILVNLFFLIVFFYQYSQFEKISDWHEHNNSKTLLSHISEATVHLDVAIIVTNSAGEIQWVSDSFETLSGFSRSDYYQKNFLRLLGVHHTPAEMTSFNNQEVFYRKDGSSFMASIDVSAKRDDRALISGFVIILRDVSKLRDTEGQLVKALAKANQSAIAKSEFLANVSHEVFTPLGGIIGFADMIHMETKEQETKELSEYIQKSARSLQKIVSDVIDLSRLESGHIRVREETVCIDEIITDIKEHVLPVVTAKELELHIEKSAMTPRYFKVDGKRLRQILLNLTGNAVKFTNQGEVSIKFDAFTSTRDGYLYLVIRIKDTGIGIPKEKQADIFDAFTQKDGGNAREHGGMGLGLTLSKKFVDLLDGSLEMYSEPSLGTELVINIPIKDKFISDVNEESSKRILVAEDNYFNQVFVRDVLEHAGHEVDIVERGDLIADAVRQNKYDLLLLDIRMPVLNGLDAAKEIRQMGVSKEQLPIIVLSATAEETQPDLAALYGLSDCLSKPIKPDALLRAVDHS